MTSSLPPRIIALDQKKEKLIDELLEKIEAKYSPLPPQLVTAMAHTTDRNAPTLHNPTRLYAYSFLNSRKWNVKHALEMAEEVIRFRKEKKFDSRPIAPSPISVRGWSADSLNAFLGREPRVADSVDVLARKIERHLQVGVHYWDKNGIPVFYVLVGRVHETALLKKLKHQAKVGESPADALWPYIEEYMLLMEELGRYQQHMAESGQLVDGFENRDNGIIRSITLVLDTRKLTYKMLWKPAIDLLIDSLKKMFAAFPDCVYQILVINSPAVVRLAYTLVKPALDSNVQSKVHIYSPSDSPAALKELIDERFIPAFLSGGCNCEGNCIASYDPSAPESSDVASDDDDEGTENLKIAARSKFQKFTAVKPGDVVSWDFAGDEVDLYVFFFPPERAGRVGGEISKSKEKDYIILQGTYQKQSHHYTAEQEGLLVVSLDNTKSWMSTAKVQLQFRKIECTPSIAEADSSEASV